MSSRFASIDHKILSICSQLLQRLVDLGEFVGFHDVSLGLVMRAQVSPEALVMIWISE